MFNLNIGNTLKGLIKALKEGNTMTKNTDDPSKVKDDKGSATNRPTENLPILSVNNLYVKEFTFKAPHSPHIFNERWNPKVEFKIQITTQLLSEKNSIYEVVLEIIATVKSGEEHSEKDAFIIDIKQAGAFTVRNLNDEQIKQILNITCPGILYPHIRETFYNFISRGSFPQITLPPVIGFDAIYQAKLKAEEQKK